MAHPSPTSESAAFTLIKHIPFTSAKVIGARASIGLVVLASDYTIEHEFRSMISIPGVDLFMARIANDTVEIGLIAAR